MDIWVVAAAAGAGYIAQHLKDLTKGGQSISESSSGSSSIAKSELLPSMQQFQEKNRHFCWFAWRKNLGTDVSEEREPISQGASTAEVTTTSGFDGQDYVKIDNYDDCNIHSQACLSPRFLSNDGLGDFGEGSGDLLFKPFIREMGSSFDHARNKRILRSKRTNGQVIKPLNSLESCLMAQLYKEHTEMEEYMLTSVPSPSSALTMRPLLVTDGSRIISRASGDCVNLQARTVESKVNKETCSEEKETVYGVPPLAKAWRKRVVSTGSDRDKTLSTSSKRTSRKLFPSQGSSNGALLFCLGISFGIISSLLSNKREVDKLNNLLKQSEVLVQDLQEELEMKESLTIKELAFEDYESREDVFRKKSLHVYSSEQNFDESTKIDHKEDGDQKAREESMRTIEAELEAELSRLELNLKSSNLIEKQLPNLVELDPDFVPDIAQGELRAEILGSRQEGDQPSVDPDGSGSSTHYSANYAVSPRELSLRLHEVIQSRLEERVKELETALQNRQKEVQYMESEYTKSWRGFSNSEAGSSSTQESPVEENLVDRPVVIHLSGDALHAYNEVYDVFAKVGGSEEHNQEKSLRSSEQNLDLVENGELNHYMSRHSISSRDTFSTFIRQEGGENLCTSSKDISTSGDEDDEDQVEMENLLIKRILEKTRNGSPVVLNAQKVLFSTDEN